MWWLVVTLLCLGVFLHLLPFYFMLSSSFKTAYELFSNPPTVWPQHPTLTAWKLVFNLVAAPSGFLNQPFGVYFRNSVVMVVGTLLLSLPVTALAAYANSKLQRGPIARWLFLFFIGTLMVPSAVTLIPQLLMVVHFPYAFTTVPTLPGSEDNLPAISLFDTAWAVIIPAGFNAFNFLMFKGFFDGIPNSVIQAARVDGGSELNIFRRIVLPMSIPVIAVAAYFQFVGAWDNNFLWVSVVFRSPENTPTSLAIYNLITQYTQAGLLNPATASARQSLVNAGFSYNGLIVLGLLQTFPTFLMFILCREFLLKGTRIRGLK